MLREFKQLGRQGSSKHPNGPAKKKKNLKSENSLRYLWDNIKHTNICIRGVPEGTKRDQGD